MTSNNRENATWGAFGCEADETDADPLSKFQQQAMLLNNGKSRLRTTRSVGGNVGSVVGRKVVVNKFDANPLSKLQQQAMLLTNENSSLRSTRRVGGNVGRTVGSGNKTDVNPLSKIQQQAMPLKNENSSLRTTPSVGGNLGSIVGREVINKTETNPLSKFQQQAMPLSSEKGSLRTIRSVGGNLGSIFGRDAVETDANPLSKFQQQAMPLSREKGSLRTIRSVSGNLGSIFGREFDETDANPLSKFQQQAMPLNNEKGSLRGIRSIGGNLGSIFGREVEKTDANPLSEFQQQSLSVFESEHMWAHFKAQLAERNIQTTAGVRAMLPEFVNDRVLDGSVRSERPVYPAPTRRRESIRTNGAPCEQRSSLGGGSNRSPDVSERSNSIDEYSQALKGESGHVLRLHKSLNTEVQRNSDAKGLSKVIPARLSIDISPRRSSVISSLGCCEDPAIDVQPNSSDNKTDNKKSADFFNSFTSDLSSSILSTLGLAKEVSIDSSVSTGETNRMSGSVSGWRPKFVRPLDSDPQLTEQDTTDIFDGNLVQVSSVTITEDDTIRSKPCSYRPIRMEKRKIEKIAQSVLSRDTSATDSLLVEWGEKDELSSDDEADEKDSRMLNNSESAAVTNRKDLIVDWNDKEDDDDDLIEDLNHGIHR